MNAYYCDQFVVPLPDGHRFPMAKYRRLRDRLLAEGILREGDLVEPAAASREELCAAHAPGYVDAVLSGTLPPEALRRIGFPWSPAMVERARRSVGATIGAARAALLDGTATSLAGGTHHAFRDRGEGYCIFNDVAVAAQVLLDERVVGRIAVVDCDVHQGNGTAAIFGDEPRVFTFSIHGEHNFPFKKERSDLDVTLPDGATDDEYLAALEAPLERVVAGFRPDLVFYVSGADPYAHDRLGRLGLTMAGLKARDRRVLRSCRRAGVPVAVVMGGGYAPDVDDIVTIHANTVREAHAWSERGC